jgi:hypothetical protein
MADKFRDKWPKHCPRMCGDSIDGKGLQASERHDFILLSILEIVFARSILHLVWNENCSSSFKAVWVLHHKWRASQLGPDFHELFIAFNFRANTRNKWYFCRFQNASQLYFISQKSK